MEIAENVVLLVHFMGWAALFGGLLIQARESEKKVNSLMRDGIGTAVVAGIALVGFLEAGDETVNHAKVGVKLAIGLIILVLVMMNVKKPKISDNLFWALLGLTVINMAIAVLW